MPPFARLAIACAALAASGASQALTINYSFLGSTTLQEQQAIRAAGNEWSAVIHDDVTLDLAFTTSLRLSQGVLGTTKAFSLNLGYDDFRTRLAAASTSATDAIAVAHLPAGPKFDRLINLTAENPAGAGSAIPYVDHGKSYLKLTAANARVLGVQFSTNESPGCATACDARIDLSNRYAYDYDPSNGISPGTSDFVGVVVHEIGHALGFFSGVDLLDGVVNTFPADTFAVRALDLFRYSSLSAAAQVIDFTADDRPKYFSVDGGATAGPVFADGVHHGDGDQASHWKNDSGLGVMQPQIRPGVLASRISSADLLAMDAIGWTVSAVPEPGTVALFLFGLAGVAGARARQRSRASIT